MAKKGRIKADLTLREEQLMQILWSSGKPMKVREMVTLYPEPHPHVNTVSTVVRTLEEKGFVAHQSDGNGYAYYTIVPKKEFRNRSISQLIRGYFGNSYLGAISTFVEEEKITVDELKELIEMIESRKK